MRCHGNQLEFSKIWTRLSHRSSHDNQLKLGRKKLSNVKGQRSTWERLYNAFE